MNYNTACILVIVGTLILLVNAEQDDEDFFYISSTGREIRGVEPGTLEQPMIIPFGRRQIQSYRSSSRFMQAAQFVFRRLNKDTSRFLLYPYSFNKTVGNTTYDFPDGAILSMYSDDAPTTMTPSWFANVVADSNIDLKRSTALYDMSIAILKLSLDFDYQSNRDVTPGGRYMCNGPLITFIGSHYSQCFTNVAAYNTYLSAHPVDHEKVSVVYVTPQDIADGFLNNVGMFIIPDIYINSQDAIVSNFTSAARDNLRSFVSGGGMIYASGKGALVVSKLNDFGVPTNTFNYTHLLISDSSSAWPNVRVKGCETAANETETMSYQKRVLCFGHILINNAWNTINKGVPIVSSLGSLETVTSWDATHRQLYHRDVITGVNTDTLPRDNAIIPALLYKTYGRGHVVLQLSTPEDSSTYYSWLFDAMWLAESRPLMIDTKVTIAGNMSIIPALETIAVGIDVIVKNTFDTQLNLTKFNLFIRSGVKLMTPYPPECTVVNTLLTAPAAGLRNDSHLECAAVIPSLQQLRVHVPVFISEVSVTQGGANNMLLYAVFQYNNGALVDVEYGPITVDAAMAALIRTDANPQPLSHYPVKGAGQYIDTVIWTENKEETEARDVVHVSVIPLISVLVDGSNQGEIVHPLEWDHLYYKSSVNGVSNYKYPFDTFNGTGGARDEDILDFKLLGYRKDFLVADWDTPVKNFKYARGTDYPTLPGADVGGIPNAGYGTNIDNDEIVLSEVWYPDSDVFYEHATQRLLAMLDAAESGPFAFYNDTSSFVEHSGGVCPSWKLHPAGNRLKTNLMFTRNDYYLYDIIDQYPLPEGVDTPLAAFTIDRYGLKPTTCTSGLGNARAEKMVRGYFNYTINGSLGNPPGLKPHEYSNELLQNCERANHTLHWDNVEALTGGKVKPIHYIMRIDDNPTVQHPTDAMYFKEVPGRNGEEYYYAPGEMPEVDYARFGTYNEVRMLWVSAADFPMAANVTKYGGRFTIVLPTGITFKSWVAGDPIGKNAINIAADKIAVTDIVTSVDLKTITVYFKGGNMPNENAGIDSIIGINIEWLNFTAVASSNFTAKLTVEEMIYDFAVNNPLRPFESYKPITTMTNINLSFTQKLALSLPALRLEYRLKRGEANDSTLMPYEYLEPYLRVGVYMQELMAHRTVWGSAEVHPISDVGLVGKSAGFMWLSNIGSAPIPFSEFLQTGSKQVIPAASTTGRIDWTDIWGRRWSQPIRSVYVDVPPIPPPERSFVMTTTFELIRPSDNARVYEWTSDEDLVVHAHMKLLNNYPKWFEITNCKENQVAQIGRAKARVFDSDTNINHVPESYAGATNHWISLGYNASYGTCFVLDPTYMNGTRVTEDMAVDIAKAHLCAASQQWYVGCDGLNAGLPHITKRIESTTTRREVPANVWNYAVQVDEHWPQNYIKDNMWDLTHYDYDDTAFDKAYKYHMDNVLPTLDQRQPRPDNIIAFPLFKGLGYNMKYDKMLSVDRIPGYHGWWSDNLMNRDNTVVAGQDMSNDVSVGKPELVPGWIDVKDLADLPESDKQAVYKNIYSCLFNRHRAIVTAGSDRISHVENVYQNNIVPIDPTLTKFDSRLFNFQCNLSQPQYSPENISLYDNYVATETARDWLYFAAALRGGARETINVLYTLQPLGNAQREGITKVQDGGRFVYWNPCCGRNAFAIIDDPVQTALASRVDFVLQQEVFPTYTTTYNANVYQLITLSDPAEIGREWTLPVYYNYLGFGDAAVSVYVGGVRDSTAILRPGDTTYVKIEFQNNAGFDWNLFDNAIDFRDLYNRPISGYDLLNKLTHAIREPLAYRFMTVNVPAYLAPYVNISCSDHNIETAPLFFDFENINVATIRDGFKGVYYYKIKLASTIPDSIRGRMHKISVTLNQQYFDKLPGTPNDPTGVSWHDYELAIPDVWFGIPYGESSPYAGKVYHTWGYGTNLTWSHLIHKNWSVLGAKVVNEQNIQDLRAIMGQTGNVMREQLHAFWTALTSTNIPYSSRGYSTSLDSYTYDLSALDQEGKNRFPLPRTSEPAVASVSFLVHTYAPLLVNDINLLSQDLVVNYSDPSPKTKNASIGSSFYVRAAGPHLVMSYAATLLDEVSMKPKVSQRLYMTDTGIARITATASNDGDSPGYDTTLVVYLNNDLTILTDKLTTPYMIEEAYDPFTNMMSQKLTLYTGKTLYTLPVGETIYVKYPPMTTDESNSRTRAPTSRLFVCKAKGLIDTENRTAVPIDMVVRVEHDFNQSYILPLVAEYGPRAILEGEKTRSLTQLQADLKVTLKDYTVDTSSYWFEWWRLDLWKEGDQQPYIFKSRTNGKTLLADVAPIDGNQDISADFYVVVKDASGNVVDTTNVYQYRNPPEWWIVVLVIVGGAGILGAFGFWLFAQKAQRQLYSATKLSELPGAARQMHAVETGDGEMATIDEAPTNQALKLGTYYRGGVSGGSKPVVWGAKGVTKSAPVVVAGAQQRDEPVDALPPPVPAKHHGRPQETWNQRTATTLSSLCCFCIVRSKGRDVQSDGQARRAVPVASAATDVEQPRRPPPARRPPPTPSV